MARTKSRPEPGSAGILAGLFHRRFYCRQGCRRSQGFSLLEVLVALTILGIAILMGMALVLQNPRIVRRMDSERQAFRAMESTLEAVRAGALPLRTSLLDGFVTAVGTPAPKDLTIWMQVEPTELPGLFRVTLMAHYRIERQKLVKHLRTMVWSPPAASPAPGES